MKQFLDYCFGSLFLVASAISIYGCDTLLSSNDGRPNLSQLGAAILIAYLLCAGGTLMMRGMDRYDD